VEPDGYRVYLIRFIRVPFLRRASFKVIPDSAGLRRGWWKKNTNHGVPFSRIHLKPNRLNRRLFLNSNFCL
jgi:hypothetical protein